MKARVTKEFLFAVDGNRVVKVMAGDIVEGRCALVAVEHIQCGEYLAEEKSIDRAPEVQAVANAPRNKKR